MEDVTGLGKLADSKLANDLYQDGLAEATKETGKALTDLTKSFRLFLAPIQLMAAAQDRLAEMCERIRSDVPEERQIEAAPSIAGPALLELRHMEDDNPITELYLNLLKRAIDRERANEAHPAFLKIIGQLSPDEAMLLHHLGAQRIKMSVYTQTRRDGPVVTTIRSDCPVKHLQSSMLLRAYAEHLQSQGIIDIRAEDMRMTINIPGLGPVMQPGADCFSMSISRFGELFVKACEP